MRVTQNTVANLVRENLQTILQRQATLEQESSTGFKVNAPSDDPVAAQQILHLNALNSATDQYARNITSGTASLSMSDSAMASMSSTLTRAKEIALAMSSDISSTADSRAAAVDELKQLKNQIISLGNTQLNGNYIFGGYKNNTAPFDAATGTYGGTDDNLSIGVDQNSTVTVAYSGAQLVSGGIPAGSAGTDIMGIFDNLTTALNAGSTAGVQAELGNLDTGLSQVNNARSLVGSSLNRLSAASSIGDSMKVATTTVLSSVQDADYVQVVSDLSKQQTAYQTAIAAAGKVAQTSLLDYLK